MANKFKKVIASMASLVIFASMTVVPVFAEEAAGDDEIVAETVNDLGIAEATTVLEEDYTADGASKSRWNPDDNNGKISSDGLLFTNTAGGGLRWSVLKLDSSITDSCVVEYDVQVKQSTNPNPTLITLGTQSAKTNEIPNTYIVQLKIDSSSAGSVNGEAFSMTPASEGTPWLHVRHIINAESDEVTTEITAGEESIYSASAPYHTSGASLSVLQLSLGKNSCTAQFKSLSIKTVEAPSINLEDINKIEVGTTAAIATVTGADDISVELTNDTDFSYSIEEGGVVSITAAADAAEGASTTATIIAAGDVTVSKSIMVTALTAQEIVDGAVEEIELSGETVTKNGDIYNVLGNFTVPVSNGAVSIAWESDNAGVSVDKTGTVNVNATGTVVLTATASYNEKTAVKEFTIVIPSTKVFYDLDFNDAATQTLASIDGPESGEYEGIIANVVTRSGANNCNYVSIAKDTAIADTNYLAIVTSNYNEDKGVGNTRRTYLTLSKMEDVTIANTLHINFDLYFAKDTSSLIFTDGTNELSVDANIAVGYGALPVEKWYNITIDSFPSNRTATITVKDADGNQLTSYETDTCLRNLTKINTNGKNDIYFYIDNLVVADAIVPVIAQTTDTVLLGETDTVATVKDATDVAVEISNTSAFEAAYENGSVLVTAKGSEPASTTVTITADNDGVIVKEAYTVSSIAAEDITAAAKAQNTVYYAADKKGQVIKPEIVDGATIYNDIVLPSTEKVTLNGFTYAADVAWEVVSGNNNITADGKISVSDKAAHTVALKKTVSYSKNGEVKSTESVTYNLSVQFDNENVLSTVSKALDDAEITGEDAEAYLKAFVYDYQVKFDAAYDANFTDIPSTVTSSITFPTKGYFGSTFTWNSTVPTVISNQGKYTKPSSKKSVTLTATIESGNAKANKQFTVSVPGSNNGGGGSGSTSSTGTTSRPTGGATLATPTTGATPVTGESGQEIVDRLQEEKEQANDKFVDVKDAAWARIAINTLAEKGIVNGVSDTEFAPNDTVTRAQFAKMLMGVFGLTASSFSTSSFSDVSTDAWYFDAVETAYNLGILEGVEEGRFDPDALITRQDMAVMVTRAANAAGKTLSSVTESIAFDDALQIADYAQASVDTLVKAGIINGMSDTEFAPLDNATRAQAAKILYGLL